MFLIENGYHGPRTRDHCPPCHEKSHREFFMRAQTECVEQDTLSGFQSRQKWKLCTEVFKMKNHHMCRNSTKGVAREVQSQK